MRKRELCGRHLKRQQAEDEDLQNRVRRAREVAEIEYDLISTEIEYMT